MKKDILIKLPHMEIVGHKSSPTKKKRKLSRMWQCIFTRARIDESATGEKAEVADKKIGVPSSKVFE